MDATGTAGAPADREAARARTRAVAANAFARFAEGLATGTWDPFFECLADDFVFHFPVGRYRGRNAGKGRAIEFFRYVSTVYPGGLHLTLDRTIGDECSVAFEFRDEGLLRGETPYRNRVLVVFDVRDGRIAAYREYFGSDGTSSD